MTDWGPPPERGDDLEPERAKLRVKLALREEVRSLLREMLPAPEPRPDLRGEVQAALRELLRDPVVAKALQGPPGQSVISGGGGGQVTIGGVPVHALAAGSGVTLTASAGVGTVAASGGLNVVTRSFTSAEIKALESTPINLVAGVTGKAYCPLLVVLHYDAGTTPYVPGGSLCLGVQSSEAVALAITTGTGFIDQATDQVCMTAQISQGYVRSVADLSGEPLQFFDDSSNPATGNGTLYVVAFYVALDV